MDMVLNIIGEIAVPGSMRQGIATFHTVEWICDARCIGRCNVFREMRRCQTAEHLPN